MICPRCSAEAPDLATDCPSCGIVFAKWRPPRTQSKAAPTELRARLDGADYEAAAMAAAAPVKLLIDPPAPPPPETLGIPHSGWRASAIGFAMACALTFFPFLSFILSPISTMVHEIGHTAVLWLFGYAAVPAFDFGNGGGVTMSDLERSSLIVWAWVAGAIALAWWQRERTGVLAAIGVGAVIYFVMYHSTKEVLAITLGGHAGEIAFGALFLYRALTGWGCKIEAERPLYALLAFMILFASLRLGFNLMGETVEKGWYLQGKGGIDNDLVTGAQILSWKLEGIARAMVLITLLAIPVALIAASQRRSIGAVAETES